MSNQNDFTNPDMKEITFSDDKKSDAKHEMKSDATSVAKNDTNRETKRDTMRETKRETMRVTKRDTLKEKQAKVVKAEKAPKEKAPKEKMPKEKTAKEKTPQKKKGLFALGHKKSSTADTKAAADPLNDLELINLMDDDALERLAEKDWEKDLEIASRPKSAADTAMTGVAKSAEKKKTDANTSGSIKEKMQTTKDSRKAQVNEELPKLSLSRKTASKSISSPKKGYKTFSHIRISMVAIALLICVLTGIVGSRMYVIKQRTEVLDSFVGVGAGLTEVSVIGQEGLRSVRDSHLQALADEERKDKEKEDKEKEELAEKDRVQVELVCQTIMGDLKIKFINEETKRVIAGVPFSVEVKGPDGKVVKYVNEDKDGIIYLSPVPAGDYTITMGDVPTGEKFKKYVKAVKSGYVAVSDTITYEVVDVTDETVTEAEAAGEQKVVNDIVEENVLQDTVAFVESTKTLISGGEKYNPIDPSQVLIPTSGQARGRVIGDFVFMSSRTPDSTTAVTDENASIDSSSSSASGESASSGASTQPETTDPAAPAKTFKAEISSAPSSMKAGESATISVTTNLKNATFNWFIADNSEAASVSGNGTSASVTAIKEGTVIVQCHVAGQDDDGAQVATIPVSCTITITQNQTQTEQKPDSSSGINPSQKITTKDNKTIYVADGSGKYIEATYGDYTAKKQLYVRSEETAVYKYTGWQVIDGATYYYTADNQRVTGNQVIRGVKYSFSSDGVLQTGNTNTGIDVSAHQGAIDWAAVKSAGVSFAIIRVGFRGYGTGRLVEDSYFRQNLQGAASNGIRVGAYIFSAATNEAEAVEEASLAINLIRGYNISYPVYIDMESSGTGTGRADNLSVATRTAIVHAFCRTVANAGYKPGVYSNTTWYNNYLNTPEFTKYSIWLAQYNTHVTYTRTKYDIWQYSSKGSIPGIGTRVDMNLGYTSY